MSPQSFRNKVKSEMVGIQSPVYKQFLKIINQVNSDGESQVTGEQKIQDASQEPIVTENDEDDNNVAISTSTASLPFHSLNAEGGAEESDREKDPPLPMDEELHPCEQDDEEAHKQQNNVDGNKDDDSGGKLPSHFSSTGCSGHTTHMPTILIPFVSLHAKGSSARDEINDTSAGHILHPGNPNLKR